MEKKTIRGEYLAPKIRVVETRARQSMLQVSSFTGTINDTGYGTSINGDDGAIDNMGYNDNIDGDNSSMWN